MADAFISNHALIIDDYFAIKKESMRYNAVMNNIMLVAIQDMGICIQKNMVSMMNLLNKDEGFKEALQKV